MGYTPTITCTKEVKKIAGYPVGELGIRDEWYEAKEAVITILEPYGAEGLATSKLEKKLKKYGLKDSYARLIAELTIEGRAEPCGGSPNGGFKLRIPQAPEPE